MSKQSELWPIPTHWEWKSIKELGSVVSGGTPSTKETSYWNGDISWISPSDLTGYSEKTISKGAKSITEKGLKNSSAKVMPAGSVHFSSRAPIGYVVISASDISTNQGFKSLIPSEGVFNEYVYYYLKSSKQLAEGRASGTTFLELSGRAFGDLPIPMPSEYEQKSIVAKIEELFTELDSGISSLKTAQEQLKIYRQALLKHAFEGKLTAQWRKDNADQLETPKQLLARIQTERETRYQQQLNDWKQAVKDWEAKGKEGRRPSKPKEPVLPQAMKLPDEHYLADLPKSWIAIKAEHLCDFITKGTTPAKAEQFSNSGEIPFIKVYNLTRSGTLDFSVEPTYVSQKTHEEFLARSKVFPNDVLMNIVGPPLGKVSIVPNTYPEWNVNQAIAIYRSGILSPKYLAEFLLFERTVNHMMAQSKATAGQFNLTLEICRNLPIPVMSTGEQSEIIGKLEEKLSNIDAVSSEINDQLYKSETLRQSILKKAFSGQLVPQDPSDEPASELLARIKAEKASERLGNKKRD